MASGWWAGIAAIFGGVAIVIALVTYYDAPGADPQPGNVINGNCNAQGANNEVACKETP
ncbi:hypothetical protein [Virgisporangium aurantiacum]|uniref:hypothetical protein n=1 Tax=Virgisporangium aurantiacum TaxID=175570 RepID=UPI001951618A|nr:hypothetical protein [Virgisporangium aurantiacum]